MQIKDYYIAARQPSKGGLHIKETSKDFPKDCYDYLNKKCLELVSSDADNRCCAVFPMGDGRFIVSMAMKVPGNQEETRPHEQIHGFVVNGEEFSKLCRNCMTQSWFHQAFFPEITKGDIEFAGVGPYGAYEFKDNLGEFRKQMKGNQLIGFYNSLKEVIRRKTKIHLIVPAGAEYIVQAACYDILPMEWKNRLSIISNGECTMTDADILITNKLQYQDATKYKQMTLKTFIEAGFHIKRCSTSANKEKKRVTAEDMVIECMEYINNPDIPGQFISKIRKIINSQTDFFEEFQMQLRYQLEMMEIDSSKLERFIQVLCLAFENYKGSCEKVQQTILPAPYDLEGIAAFLKNKTTSKRKYEGYLEAFWKLQVKSYEHLIPKRRLQRTLHKI